MEGRGSDSASGANATPYNAKISVLLSPSDPNGGRVNDNCYYGSVGPTTNAGSNVPPRPTNPTCSNYSSRTSGVFGFLLSYGLRDITDGSSNAIAFSEVSEKTQRFRARPRDHPGSWSSITILECVFSNR